MPSAARTVLHAIVPEPPGELGGAEMHVLDLAVWQRSAGLRPVIAERGSAEFAATARAAGLEVVSATGQGRAAAVRLLAATARELEPDIVHAHGYDADYWAAAARARDACPFRGRLVLTQHGIVEDTAWHKAKTALDALCARAADGVIVCAAGLLARMRRWSPRARVAYIPNGVGEIARPARDEARARLAARYGVPLAGPLVGYVGRLAAEKRPDRVVEVAALLRGGGVDAHTVMAGSGPLAPRLRRQARLAGVGDAVTFAGLVRDAGVVYGALDAMVLLSDTETTSRVVIEAMMAGVPVVASAVGGVPELLDHGRAGTLVPAGDARAAADALRATLAAGRPGDEVAARARSRYGIETMGASIGRFYEDLLVRPGRSADGLRRTR